MSLLTEKMRENFDAVGSEKMHHLIHEYEQCVKRLTEIFNMMLIEYLKARKNADIS